MASTYVNDLRLNEMATGDASGTWGTITNTNLELIGEALGYGTQDCFTSDADATTTVADGATDPARAMYFKVTSSATLTATRTLTIAPNTVSRLQFIENATTGSQSINISQGSGANVTIGSGETKAVYLDGAGSGAAVVDSFATFSVANARFADGSNSAPSISFTSDTNTGIYRGGTDILKFVTAGTDAITIDASQDVSLAGSLNFADNEKAIFGAGSDLQIYHDGVSTSYIKASSDLFLQGTDDVVIRDASTLEEHIRCNLNDSVDISYNGAVKLATTSTGIDIGVGTASVYTDVNIKGASTSNYGAYLGFLAGGTTFGKIANYGRIQGGTSNDFFITTATTNNLLFGINNTEKARIDSSGNLLVGQTSQAYGTVGASITQTGQLGATADGDSSLILNRKTSDGTMVQFRKDNTVIGSIGTLSGYLAMGDDVGILFNNANPSISAFNASTNANRDGAIDIGASNARFKDLYLSGNVLTSNIYGQNDGNTGIQFEGSDVITIHTNGAERMRFHAGGQLSLATTDATHGFNVGQSGTDFRGRFQGNNQYRLGLQNGTNNLVWLGSGGADNFRVSNSGGSTLMELTSAGQVVATSFSGDGSNLTGISGGKIAQVQNVAKSDTFSTNTSSPDGVAITGMQVNITPSATSSKVLVTVSLGAIGCSTSASRTSTFQLYRGSTQIAEGNADGSRPRVTFRSWMTSGDTNHALGALSFSFLDSPSSTSALSYKLHMSGSHDSQTFYLNRSGADGNGSNNYQSRTISTMQCMEVLA